MPKIHENKFAFDNFTYELITTSNAAWAPPVGVTTIDVFMIGGGGGGSAYDGFHQGLGGGSGGKAIKLGIAVSGTYALVIGAGGAGGVNTDLHFGGATTGFGESATGGTPLSYVAPSGGAGGIPGESPESHILAGPAGLALPGDEYSAGSGGWGFAGVSTGAGGNATPISPPQPFGSGGPGANSSGISFPGSAGCILIRYRNTIFQ